ncbi:Ribokinase-like protein [Tilletiopsis washingtonensis]|uniref:Ribokinase-like protein n=1 Tax=Tilletiopsis washingtonensis TaxID=58919 RepID=A0A316Z6D5_9BASI|nr:Ribokinase-like protein [Tilletiopsis washingtonensis]PWN97131.1 Ribokinase-like protein [Tilletiopsis washingtonensis]
MASSSSDTPRATLAADPLVGTLGMFIIDTFRVLDEASGAEMRDPLQRGEQIGGGGVYFAVGARVWLRPERILGVIDAGPDFPAALRNTLEAFNAAAGASSPSRGGMWAWRSRPDGTTRAVNVYRGQHRGFEYLSPRLRLEPSDIAACSPCGRLPRWLHCICAPDRLLAIVAQLRQLRSDDMDAQRIVWEPIPDSATAQNLPALLEAMRHVHVVSPNHDEAAAFLSHPPDTLTSREACTALVERLGAAFAHASPEAKAPLICVRCGALGAVALGAQGVQAVQAWHRPEQAASVVDVTGAGNAFLGGLTAALSETAPDMLPVDLPQGAIRHALSCAAVSASYALEQLGLPSLSSGSAERWNGDEPSARLRELEGRR